MGFNDRSSGLDDSESISEILNTNCSQRLLINLLPWQQACNNATSDGTFRLKKSEKLNSLLLV